MWQIFRTSNFCTVAHLLENLSKKLCHISFVNVISKFGVISWSYSATYRWMWLNICIWVVVWVLNLEFQGRDLHWSFARSRGLRILNIKAIRLSTLLKNKLIFSLWITTCRSRQQTVLNSWKFFYKVRLTFTNMFCSQVWETTRHKNDILKL